MRSVTRNAVLVVVGLVVVLLALGAVPSLIETGDPYHVEATEADADGPAVGESYKLGELDELDKSDDETTPSDDGEPVDGDSGDDIENWGFGDVEPAEDG